MSGIREKGYVLKVIFFDIDGVLNNRRYLSTNRECDMGIYTHLDRKKIALLALIVQKTEARLVLSSSWREMFDQMRPTEQSAEDLIIALHEHGLELWDMTKKLGVDRGDEIREYLSRHDDIEAFIIFDDDASYDWRGLEVQWLRTKYSVGLTAKIAEEAVAILSK